MLKFNIIFAFIMNNFNRVQAMKKLSLITLLVISIQLSAEMLNYDKALSNLKGVKSYRNEDYSKADSLFSSNSIKYPNDSRLHFNKGNAQYKKGELENAEASFNRAIRNQDFLEKSKALQNLGNVKFQQQDYQNAIKNYRDALIEDPENSEARYNYELAARMLQRQQQQKQQQQGQGEDQQENDEKQQQQQGQQNEDEEQQEKQQQQQEQKSEEQNQQERQQLKEEERKKEDAEKILNALLQKEKEEMKKEKQKLNIDREKKGKYW